MTGTKVSRQQRRKNGSLATLLLALVMLAATACSSAKSSPAAPTASAAASAEAGPVLTATAIGQPAQTPSPVGASPSPSPTHEPIACPERVLIISLDGLRGDAVSSEATPNIDRLAQRGAYSLDAQTILPSVTLPAHASMLSGYDVSGHGVYWNAYVERRGYIRSATVFSIAHEGGLHTAMVVGKEKLIHIAIPGTVDDYAEVRGSGDMARAEASFERIRAGFGVLFIHLRGPDNAGHRSGWMSAGYLETVAESDAAVGAILEALRIANMEDTTLVILSADHGGHNRTHGSDRPEDTTIPWIIAGPGVLPGLHLTMDVRVFDTAATALWALGLPLPEDVLGIPIREAFAEGIEIECQLP